MSYADLTDTLKRKFAAYDENACDYAIMDCHATLKLWGDKVDPEYARKLWAEIDALRDRKMALARKTA